MAPRLKHQIVFLLIVYAVSRHTCNSKEDEKCLRDEEKIICEGRQCGLPCVETCKVPRSECQCDGSCGYVCVPKALKCKLLTAPNFGFVETPKGRGFHATADYSCSAGHNLIGLPTRICRSDGRWSGTKPFCMAEEFLCKPPTFLIKNAKIVSKIKDEYQLGDEVRYQCTEDPIRDIITTCEISDGETYWTDIDLSCPEPPVVTCNTPEKIENGYYEGGDFLVGSKITYHCYEGYFLDGPASITCTNLGAWTRSPPSCITTRSCEEPKSIQNGKVRYDKPFVYLSNAFYTCDRGFTLDGPMSRQCNEEGKLTGAEPRCLGIDCGRPKTPIGGAIVTLEGTKVNQRVRYKCNEHTTVEGQITATCKLEDKVFKWSSPPPFCRQHCQVPRFDTSDAYFTYKKNRVERGDYVPHQQTIDIFCGPVDDYGDYGAEISATSTYTCVNGKWDHEISCKTEPCKVPAPEKESVYFEVEKGRIRSGGFVPHLQFVKLFCDTNLEDFDYVERLPTSTYKCVNGKWSGKISCKPEPEESGEVSTTPKSGPEENDCGKPKTSKYVKIRYFGGTKLNQRVEYTCENNTTIEGQEVAMCVFVNGILKWSSPPPTCKQRCKVPDLGTTEIYIQHNNKNVEPGSYVPHLDAITVFCEYDYWDFGAPSTPGITSKCLDGTWNNKISCTAGASTTPKYEQTEHCKVPKLNIEDGYYIYETAKVEAGDYVPHLKSLRLFCHSIYDYEYDESTQATSTHKCLNGKWSSKILCKAEGSKDVTLTTPDLSVTATATPKSTLGTECQQPKAPKHGKIHYLVGRKLNQRVDYTCDKHTTMQGQSTATCQLIRGMLKWSSSPPICWQHCKLPRPDTPDAYFKYKDEKFAYGNYVPHQGSIDLYCNSDDEYGDYGASRTYTCLNGKWSHEIGCKPGLVTPGYGPHEKCKIPVPNKKNAYFLLDGEKIEPGKSVPHLKILQLFCDSIFDDYDYIDSHATSTYNCVNGKWSEEIRCKIEPVTPVTPVTPGSSGQCKVPELDVTNGYIMHGNAKIEPGEYVNHMQRVELFCDSNYDYRDYSDTATEATSTHKCVNGKWSTEIRCKPGAEVSTTPKPTEPPRTECVQPKTPKHVKIHYLVGRKLNQRVEYTCDKHTTMQGQSTATCQLIHGILKWSSPPPFCWQHCKLPKPDTPDAYFKYKDEKFAYGNYVPHQDSIDLYCNSDDTYGDYDAANTYTCLNGLWSHEIGCKPGLVTPGYGPHEKCKIPAPNKKNAYFLLDGEKIEPGKSVPHLKILQLFCDSIYDYDYIDSQATSSYNCVNGKWSSEILCKPDGFEDISSTTPKSDTLGQCQLPKLNTKMGYYMHKKEKIEPGDYVNHLERVGLFCDLVYDYDHPELSTKATSIHTCVNGKWNSEIRCKPVVTPKPTEPPIDFRRITTTTTPKPTEPPRTECVQPKTPKHVKIHYLEGRKLNQRVTYTCENHTVMDGQSTATCKLINGILKWSSPPPFCRRPCKLLELDTSEPYFIMYKDKELKPEDFVPHLGHIEIFCNAFYDYMDFTVVNVPTNSYKCLDGIWSSEIGCELRTTKPVTTTTVSSTGILKKCIVPEPDITNAYFLYNGVKIEPGKYVSHFKEIKLFCNATFDGVSDSVTGTTATYKCVNGKWSGRIQCAPIPVDGCELPEHPSPDAYYTHNGKKIEPGKFVEHLGHVTLICDEEFDSLEYDASNEPPNYVCVHGYWNKEMYCKPKVTIGIPIGEIVPTRPTYPDQTDIIITYKLDGCKEFEYKSGDLEIPRGSQFTLRCLWVGSKTASLTWNDEKPNFGRSRQGEYNEFFINKVDINHAGRYACTSSTGKKRRINIVVRDTIYTTRGPPTQDTGCPASSYCNMDVFVNGTQLKRVREYFRQSTSLAFRCTSPQEFRLIGNTSTSCNNGEWTSEWPTCVNIYPNDDGSHPPVDFYSWANVKSVRLNNGDYWISKENGGLFSFRCFYGSGSNKPDMSLNGIDVNSEESIAHVGYDPYKRYWSIQIRVIPNLLPTRLIFKCENPGNRHYSNSVTLRFE